MNKDYLKKMLQRAARVKTAIQLLEKVEQGQLQQYSNLGIRPRFQLESSAGKLCIREHYSMNDYMIYNQTVIDNRKVLLIYNRSGIPGLYIYLEKINRHIRGYVWGNVVEQSK